MLTIAAMLYSTCASHFFMRSLSCMLCLITLSHLQAPYGPIQFTRNNDLFLLPTQKKMFQPQKRSFTRNKDLFPFQTWVPCSPLQAVQFNPTLAGIACSVCWVLMVCGFAGVLWAADWRHAALLVQRHDHEVGGQGCPGYGGGSAPPICHHFRTHGGNRPP